ncbi:MAG: TonB-dependent receptor [Verrucomicrobia bacterium]|nr:TonB-dependent receptor [Verrucomicrobiota bacterium]
MTIAQRTRWAGTALAALLCGGAFVTAAQQDTPPPDEKSSLAPRLDEVVVTPTRTGTTLFDAPYTAQTVTAEDIQTRQLSRTLPEALRETPGVMVQKTALGQGSPFIRGFTGFRTLMLIDGIRLNNSVFREGPNQYWNTVDPLSVERLEVVKGPSSVLYGSDAIGGTVNAITQRRQEFGEGFSWSRSAYYRYATAEDSHTGRATIGGNVDRQFGFLVGVSPKDYGDLRSAGPVGDQKHTGYSELDGDVKAEYFPTPDSKLVVVYQRVDQDDAWRTHRTIHGKSWEGTTVGNERQRSCDQNRDLVYVQYHAEKLEGPVDVIRASLSFQKQTEDEAIVAASGVGTQQGFAVGTVGTWFQLESPSPVGRWTYGMEHYRDSVSSYNRTYTAGGALSAIAIQGPVADDSTYDLLGLFAQDDIPIGERFNFVIGGRYTHAAVDAGLMRNPITGTPTSLSNSWDSGVGSGRLLCRLDEENHWHLFAGASQGFRAPNLSDLTRLDTARTGELETAAPNLKPEQFLTSEIGVKALYENWSAELAYYYTVIDDMIVRQPTGAIVDGLREVTKNNGGNGFVQGLEFSTRYRFHPEWTAAGWATWMDGQADQFPTSAPVVAREPLSRMMPPTGYISMMWEHPNKRFWAEALTTIAARQDRLSTEDRRDTQRIPPGGTPGYAAFTVRGGWRITPDVSLTVAVENLTDEDYRIVGSGLNEPGRNIVASFSAKF